MFCTAVFFMQEFARYFLLGAYYLASVSGWLEQPENVLSWNT